MALVSCASPLNLDLQGWRARTAPDAVRAFCLLVSTLSLKDGRAVREWPETARTSKRWSDAKSRALRMRRRAKRLQNVWDLLSKYRGLLQQLRHLLQLWCLLYELRVLLNQLWKLLNELWHLLSDLMSILHELRNLLNQLLRDWIAQWAKLSHGVTVPGLWRYLPLQAGERRLPAEAGIRLKREWLL